MTDDDLVAAAEVGETVRAFMESDAGQSLIAQAEAHALEAMNHLGDTDPEDRKTIIKWQIELKAAKLLIEKLRLLEHIGDNALEVWRQQNDGS